MKTGGRTDGKKFKKAKQRPEMSRPLRCTLSGRYFIYIISYLMFYKQTLLPKNSDIVAHMKHALSLDLVLEPSHCGWHLACWDFICLPADLDQCGCRGSERALSILWQLW